MGRKNVLEILEIESLLLKASDEMLRVSGAAWVKKHERSLAKGWRFRSLLLIVSFG